jgi:MarR family transcriptional repressor of mepA
MKNENRRQPVERKAMEGRRHSFEDAPLGYKFKLINDKFTSHNNEELKKDDLTFSQIALLLYLEKNKDHRVTQKELCEGLHVKHPTMIGLISRMEEKGLLKQTIDSENRRFRIIVMTEKSEVVLRRMKQNHEDTNRILTHGFSEAEVAALNALLTRIYRNMEELS